MGDWFSFKDHTVIRIFGFEGKPYKFLVFLTIRILAMEYVRYIFLLDELDFKGSRRKMKVALSEMKNGMCWIYKME